MTFYIDEPTGSKVVMELREQPWQQPQAIGGVKKDHVEPARIRIDKIGRFHRHQLHLRGAEFQRTGSQHCHHVGAGIHHHNPAGPPGRCFEAHGATSREQIEAAFAAHILSQPVENGLADAVGRRPQLDIVGEGEDAASPLASYDANFVFH